VTRSLKQMLLRDKLLSGVKNMSMEDNMGRMRDNEFSFRRIKKMRRKTHGKIKGRI
jgi:hypothetical protein